MRPGKRDGAYKLNLDERWLGTYELKDGQGRETPLLKRHHCMDAGGDRGVRRQGCRPEEADEVKRRRRRGSAAKAIALGRSRSSRSGATHDRRAGAHGPPAGNELLVPRRDMRPTNCQPAAILPNGDKRNSPGRVDDTWHVIGTLGATILVAEGLLQRTAHEVTGRAAVVFGSDNLEAGRRVAEATLGHASSSWATTTGGEPAILV